MANVTAEAAVVRFGLDNAPAAFRSIEWEASFTPRGLSGLALRAPRSATAPVTRLPSEYSARFVALKRMLLNRLKGGRDDFSFDEFDLTGSGAFHLRAWKAMHKIPFGETATYGEVAGEAGSPLAFRAAGQACNANRIVLFIPCHRVLAAGGLGGFGCGLEWKKKFLALEGIQISECASPALGKGLASASA